MNFTTPAGTTTSVTRDPATAVTRSGPAAELLRPHSERHFPRQRRGERYVHRWSRSRDAGHRRSALQRCRLDAGHPLRELRPAAPPPLAVPRPRAAGRRNRLGLGRLHAGETKPAGGARGCERRRGRHPRPRRRRPGRPSIRPFTRTPHSRRTPTVWTQQPAQQLLCRPDQRRRWQAGHERDVRPPQQRLGGTLRRWPRGLGHHQRRCLGAPARNGGQTEAHAQGTANEDDYFITALAMQIDVVAPGFWDARDATSVNRSTAEVGDVLTYTVEFDNKIRPGGRQRRRPDGASPRRHVIRRRQLQAGRHADGRQPHHRRGDWHRGRKYHHGGWHRVRRASCGDVRPSGGCCSAGAGARSIRRHADMDVHVRQLRGPGIAVGLLHVEHGDHRGCRASPPPNQPRAHRFGRRRSSRTPSRSRTPARPLAAAPSSAT